MPSISRTVLVDTGFWFAFYDPRDQYHKKAVELADVLETTKILIPWPSLYETVNTRFVKMVNILHQFDLFLKNPKVVLLPDENYREIALRAVMVTAKSRSISLTDMIIRLILEDQNIRKHGILTFNEKDFSDLCRKYQLEIIQ